MRNLDNFYGNSNSANNLYRSISATLWFQNTFSLKSVTVRTFSDKACSPACCPHLRAVCEPVERSKQGRVRRAGEELKIPAASFQGGFRGLGLGVRSVSGLWTDKNHISHFYLVYKQGCLIVKQIKESTEICKNQNKPLTAL